jgi:hypothetical protein
MNPWFIFLGAVSWPFIKVLGLAINRAIVEHRRKRFLTLVSVKFPDNESITFIAVDSSDRKSLKDVERQLRAQFNVPEDDLETNYTSGGGFRN